MKGELILEQLEKIIEIQKPTEKVILNFNFFFRGPKNCTDDVPGHPQKKISLEVAKQFVLQKSRLPNKLKTQWS